MAMSKKKRAAMASQPVAKKKKAEWVQVWVKYDWQCPHCCSGCSEHYKPRVGEILTCSECEGKAKVDEISEESRT